MSEIPMEYKVMKKKFFKSVQKALKDDLVGIVVYGGSASDRIFSGVSDIDFFIILKSLDKLSKPLSEVYSTLSEEIMQYFEDPLFSSILDYEIYVEDQLPTKDDYKGFSPVRTMALASGELLVGENPFKDIVVSDEDLLSGARGMIQDYLDKLVSVLFMPRFEIGEDDDESGMSAIETEKEFLAVDAILSSAQAYQMVQRKQYVNMPDVVFYGETEPIDGVDNQLLLDAGLLRQGVEVESENFYMKAIDFVGGIIKLLN